MTKDADKYTYRGMVFSSQEARDLYVASRTSPPTAIRQSSRPNATKIVAGFVAALAVFGVLRGFATKDTTDTATTMDKAYPGAWTNSFHPGITGALAKNGASGCAEYAYKKSAISSSEYLVYCTADGKNWSAFLVWPAIGEVVGPNKISPDIRPPR